jgi:GDP-4-dehydro-6-deoxy-D-mannose reductase
MKVLITGSSGFIGRYLAASALERGHEVTGTYLGTSELAVLNESTKGVRWEQMDIQDRPAVDRIVDQIRPDAVFHLAAQAYALKAWADPADTFRTNVLGTIYLYEALRRHRPSAGALIAASGAQYGIPPRLPISEDFQLNATNPYGVSKGCQDMLSYQYHLNFDLRILRARLFGTTGPGKTGDAMNDFARQVAQLERAGHGGQIHVGNLDTLRDVSDVRDTIRALWTIFEHGDPKQPVNVAAGQSYSIRDIAGTLIRLARVPIELVPDPKLMRPTDELDNRADVSRLRALGHQPKYPLDRTISDALDYWRSAPVGA